jgi:AmmeMemoRadiSam system protein A
MKKKGKPGVDPGLTDDEKRILHEIARAAIRAKLQGISLQEPTPATETLQEKRGAFVSLHRHGSLRGCIGYIRAEKPLCRAVQEMALAAAFQDPRFEPLSAQEVDDLDIEISVLTPLQQIADSNEIEIGRHGLMLINGYNSGLLLPQVATQYGWNRETFLEHTCMKAGLPADAWKNKNTKIFIFSADVF